MMFVLAYTSYRNKNGAPSTEGLDAVYVALTTVQVIGECGNGWTELRTHNHLLFYIPRSPQRIAEGGIAFGLS